MAAPGLLVLWDVDRTLLNAGGMSPQLYRAVFAELFGRELTETAPMAGRTDRAIITETLTMAGVPDPRRHVAAFMAAMTRQAPAYGELVRRRGHVLPGAVAALTALAALAAGGGTNGTGAVHQSVLTGNIRPLAEVKLGAFGLTGFLELDIGAYGESHEARSELVHVARERARAATGTGSGTEAARARLHGRQRQRLRGRADGADRGHAAGRGGGPRDRGPRGGRGHRRLHRSGPGQRGRARRPAGSVRHASCAGRHPGRRRHRCRRTPGSRRRPGSSKEGTSW